jgi:hypothetical protein
MLCYVMLCCVISSIVTSQTIILYNTVTKLQILIRASMVMMEVTEQNIHHTSHQHSRIKVLSPFISSPSSKVTFNIIGGIGILRKSGRQDQSHQITSTAAAVTSGDSSPCNKRSNATSCKSALTESSCNSPVRVLTVPPLESPHTRLSSPPL